MISVGEDVTLAPISLPAGELRFSKEWEYAKMARIITRCAMLQLISPVIDENVMA
jgi:hypothetical protein